MIRPLRVRTRWRAFGLVVSHGPPHSAHSSSAQGSAVLSRGVRGRLSIDWRRRRCVGLSCASWFAGSVGLNGLDPRLQKNRTTRPGCCRGSFGVVGEAQFWREGHGVQRTMTPRFRGADACLGGCGADLGAVAVDSGASGFWGRPGALRGTRGVRIGGVVPKKSKGIRGGSRGHRQATSFPRRSLNRSSSPGASAAATRLGRGGMGAELDPRAKWTQEAGRHRATGGLSIRTPGVSEPSEYPRLRFRGRGRSRPMEPRFPIG